MNYKEKFKNLRRTPWFSGEVKPAYPGVYERNFHRIGLVVFQYWDGEKWWASENGSRHTSFFQDDRDWRGCSEDTTGCQ